MSRAPSDLVTSGKPRPGRKRLPPQQAALPEPSRESYNAPVIGSCVALVIAALAVYLQTAGFAFINYDDQDYVYENPMVKAGLTLKGIGWAFTTFAASNWHPLTWLSLMLDSQLFGMNAGAFHLVNAAIHLASSVILFVTFLRLTRKPWRSVMVAGIFALHPLHVESVAWVAERKDVLSAFFAILTLFLYARYAEAPGLRRYAPVLIAFGLGLTAKPMLVTLPLVLLLLDIWPIRRLKRPLAWRSIASACLEKVPLLVMSLAASAVVVAAQQKASLTALPMFFRLLNVASAYLKYIGKAFWPSNLALLYPLYIGDLSTTFAISALLLLLIASCVSILMLNRRPYLFVGWFWYLGMLVPVIGFVQVGTQAMADRYMYLPMIGLSIPVIWGVADLVEKYRSLRVATAVAGGAALLSCSIASYNQVQYWRTAGTLFQHGIDVTGDNFYLRYCLGRYLDNQRQHSDAMAQYRIALEILPSFNEAKAHLLADEGMAFLNAGRIDEAYSRLTEAARLWMGKRPAEVAFTHGELAAVLAAHGDFEQAEIHLDQSINALPDNPEHQKNLCTALQRLGRNGEANDRCSSAIRLQHLKAR